jgi:hypothetical protein
MRWIYLITKTTAYLVDPAGRIARMDQAGFMPSSTWRLVGLEGPRRAFLSLAALQGLADAGRLATGLGKLHTRAGEPRYRVRDYDHGTFRTWMSPGLVEVRSVAPEVAAEMLQNRDRAAQIF